MSLPTSAAFLLLDEIGARRKREAAALARAIGGGAVERLDAVRRGATGRAAEFFR